MLEPYAMKVARTVLSGGKAVRPYLSQLETLVPLSVNDEWWFLELVYSGFYANAITIPPCEYGCKTENKKISRSWSKRSEACCLIR